MNNKNLLKMVDQLKDKFGDKLRSILVYGSVLRDKAPSDIDLIVLLKEKDTIEDLKKLKQVTEDYEDGVLDMQLLYNEEIVNPKLFSLDTHGSFFVEVLKHSKAVYGDNPFDEIVTENEDRQRSALNKVQNYMFRARQEAIGLGRHSKDINPFYHRKKIMRIMDDIMIFDGNLGDRTEIIKRFIVSYPDVLNESDMKIMSEDKVYSIEEYMVLYEKLYSFLIKRAQINVPSPLKKPNRVRIGEIISEFVNVEGSNKAMIILEGLPSVPDEKRVLNIFANQGYSVFYPRYKGTWESGGEFMKESPVNDIEELIDALVDGIDTVKGEVKFDEIYVIASSFGGSVSLCLKNRPELKRVIAMSPVYDYTKIPSLSTLSGFIRKMFGQAYRYKEENWKKLLSGDVIRPEESLEKFDDKSKFVIFAGEGDKDIPAECLKEFADKVGIDFYSFKGVGHLSYSKFAEEVLEKALLVL